MASEMAGVLTSGSLEPISTSRVMGSVWLSAHASMGPNLGWALRNLAAIRSDQSGNLSRVPSYFSMWAKSLDLT
eukprot:1334181-Heterocapsa_arctica.AAC.1